MRGRRRWFERHPGARRRLASPVISVGNLSVGGAGKTPVVQAIASWLLAAGERPAILSRGYGRADRADGVVVVSDGSSVCGSLAQSGDEPLMLARALPGVRVLVSEDRYLAGAFAETRLDATVHLLDDGFQHLRLARDVDVLVTSVGEIGGGRVLPFGRLREPADAAARAHVVIVFGADAAGARSEAWTLGISQSLGATRVVGPPPAGTGEVTAVAGIAHPDRFFAAIAEAGWLVARTIAFPDHHRYTRRDLDRIGGGTMVTTAKDAVRFEALAPLPFVMRVAPLRLRFDQWDTLAATLSAGLVRARSEAAS